MRWARGIPLAVATAAGGCFTPSDFEKPSGGPGGGLGGGAAGTGATSEAGVGGTSSAGGAGGNGAVGGTGGGFGGAAGTAGGFGGASTGGAGGSGGTTCAASEHRCGAQCVGNTPDTGCLLSSDCSPCPLPTNAVATSCDSLGRCDFTCSAGYNKTFGQCSPACGPTAVIDTTKCPTGGYGYWCADTRTCWGDAIDCWTAVQCNADGWYSAACNCGYHLDCNTLMCVLGIQRPPCGPIAAPNTACTQGYRCPATNQCWSVAGDCRTQIDSNGDGTLDGICPCGQHQDLTTFFSCPAW